MRAFLFLILATAIPFLIQPSALAQTVTRSASIRQERQIDENTKIVDKKTGKPVSYKEYQDLLNKDRDGYHLEAIIDEYGKESAYTLRPMTQEERETHSVRDYDTSLRPKVGEPMPEFVMKGIDNKVYRLTELKGHVLVLGFWISLRKPFWGPNQAKPLADILASYPSKADIISLGILQDSAEAIASVMATQTLPFVPIPNSYTFNQKFQVTRSPSFIVIDRLGKVAAFVDGQDYDQLNKALQAASR
ncbi:TlpA family protein disulfide reductase [Spirosoma luteum]|uniref:TlpA family protein disulfide reductase n=1 Tax=Spirosoma luteum TaxID=431553 RepID=UPI00036537E5|nr:redoxin domain-containing protein [Spirosoma luteum]